MLKKGNELYSLARLALSGRQQDIHAYLHRVAKQKRASDPELADSITSLLREAPTRSSPLRKQGAPALPVDLDSRAHLLRVEEVPHLDHEPVYSDPVGTALEQIINERMNVEALLSAGLEPSKSALFVGPPGVGKTMAARWLALQLGKPLLILDLAAVMSSYLGKTGTNLRHVLEYAKSIDCVFLLDEIDAIAKRRDDQGEIGELKRLVTVLIQQLDDWPSANLLLAATNHSDLLDPAIWRRFDQIIDFPMPQRESAFEFIKTQLESSSDRADLWASVLALAYQGSSFSDIEKELLVARRSAVLSGENLDKHLQSLIRSDNLDKQSLIELATSLVRSELVSQHAAHKITGVARDTIRSRMAKDADVRGRR